MLAKAMEPVITRLDTIILLLQRLPPQDES